MSDVDTRALSASRPSGGRLSDVERGRSPLRTPQSEDPESHSSYHEPLSLEEDAAAEVLGASSNAAQHETPLADLDIAQKTRLESKQHWFELMQQFRTHIGYVYQLVQRPDSTKDPDAGDNDITDESSFLSLTTGYHARLCQLSIAYPEASIPLGHVFRSLGGRWSAERRANVRDEAFIVTTGRMTRSERQRVDLTDPEQLRTFRNLLATPKAVDDETVRAVIVPDLSPLFVELLGGLLGIDHRVFTNHLWCEFRRPFLVPNRQALDVRADNDDPHCTVTVDVDSNATTWVEGGLSLGLGEKNQVRQRVLAYFGSSRSFFPFLDRAFDAWPASLAAPTDTMHELSASFHATSRATVHWIESASSPVQIVILLTPSNAWALNGSNRYTNQGIDHTWHCRDEGDCFLHEPRSTTDAKAHLAPPDEAERYCADIERILLHARDSSTSPPRSDLACLQWLAEKVLANTQSHIQADRRRLNAFRLARDPASTRRRGPNPGDPESDPLRDLQYFRDRIVRRQQTAELLVEKLHHCAYPTGDPEQSSQLEAFRSLVRRFPGTQQRLTQLQTLIANASADEAAALQRRLTQLQLEEARKSIAQGAMVRKLTVLAFIFVPVSATASAFGMNLGPLLSNPPPVYSFIVAAVGLTIMLVALATGDAVASTIRGLRHASMRKGGRGSGGPRVVERTSSGLKRRETPPAQKNGLLGTLVGFPVTALLVTADALTLLFLPVRIGARILRYVHAEGEALRAEEDREVDTLLKARLAFREGPIGVWWEAWGRGWGLKR